jgi:hypothetical protein
MQDDAITRKTAQRPDQSAPVREEPPDDAASDPQDVETCIGCKLNRPGQDAHMEIGGCLWTPDAHIVTTRRRNF